MSSSKKLYEEDYKDDEFIIVDIEEFLRTYEKIDSINGIDKYRNIET